MKLEDGKEKDAALLEVATEFKDLLGMIDKTTDKVIAERASGGFTGMFDECVSMPPDINAECLARPSNEHFDFAAQVDPLSTTRFIIQSAGWPGMGMIYYTVASQIEAMNTTARTVGADTKLSLGDLRATSRIGSTLRSRTQTDSARAQFASDLVDESSAANIPEIADISASASFTKWLSSVFGKWGEGIAGTAETVATGANLKVSEFFSEFFISRSAPEALYNYSSTWIGIVNTVMVSHDILDALPVGKALTKGLGFASDLAMGKKDKKGDRQGNFTQQGFSFAMQFIFTFTTIIAFINVAVLPKLPAQGKRMKTPVTAGHTGRFEISNVHLRHHVI